MRTLSIARKCLFTVFSLLFFASLDSHADCIESYSREIAKEHLAKSKKSYRIMHNALIAINQEGNKALANRRVQQFLSTTLLAIRQRHGEQIIYDQDSVYLTEASLLDLIIWLNQKNFLCPEDVPLSYKSFIKVFHLLWKDFILNEKATTPAMFLNFMRKDFHFDDNEKAGRKTSFLLAEAAAMNYKAFFALHPSLEDVVTLLKALRDKGSVSFSELIRFRAVQSGLVQLAEHFIALLAIAPTEGSQSRPGSDYARALSFLKGDLGYFLDLAPTLAQIMIVHDFAARELTLYNKTCLALKARNTHLIRTGDDFVMLLKTISPTSSAQERGQLETLRNDAIKDFLELPLLSLEDIEALTNQRQFKFSPSNAQLLMERKRLIEEYNREVRIAMLAEREEQTLKALKNELVRLANSENGDWRKQFTIELPSATWLLDNFVPDYQAIGVHKMELGSNSFCVYCDAIDKERSPSTCQACLKELVALKVQEKSYPILHAINNQAWVEARDIIAAGVSAEDFSAWQYGTLLHIFRHHLGWVPCFGADCQNGSLANSNDEKQMFCAICGETTCLSCGVIHKNMNCESYQRKCEADLSFNKWAKQKSAKPCPYEDCKVMTEKNGGCSHMFCRNCQRHWDWKKGI